MHKVGRNDPCPCGSGKKFKKCCETKQKHRTFQAEVLSPNLQDKTQKLGASFFQKHQPPTEHPPQDL